MEKEEKKQEEKIEIKKEETKQAEKRCIKCNNLISEKDQFCYICGSDQTKISDH